MATSDEAATPTGDGAGKPTAPVPAELELADTRVGRRLLSAVVVLLVGAMLISNLPPSELEEQLEVLELPITDATGLSQNWALFAPNPRSTVLRLRAEIERADGTVTEWTPPVGDRFLGVYRSYRWRKWANGVVDTDASLLHRGAAEHLASRFADEGAPITQVRLYRGTYRQPPPGSGQPADRTPEFEEELLFTSRPSADEPEDGGS